jgi:cellulose synthase/poly-beta-1,6-N-acetylglucosamine synthase-like glycosyltransferase
MSPLDALLTLAALPLLGAAGYLALLSVVARRPTPPAPAHSTRFDIVVPAHDEELGVADTVRSLLALDYPKDRFRVVVVADNCKDHTAERAEAAGATVLVRHDAELRGKGHALAHAFERLAREGAADAFVVIDADTLVTANLLAAFSARIAAGAEALQSDYAVRNRDSSWRTRLLHLAFTLFQTVRSSARERLGLSCGLRGNGMAFTRGLLARVPHDAFSIVEDVEYGIRLGRAGVRVHYVEEARVFGEMPASEHASRSQRSRWEAGRLALARRLALPLLREAVVRRSPLLLDLALDLAVPPISYLAAGVLVGLAASLAGLALGFGTLTAGAAFGLAATLLLVHVARGWREAGLGWRGLVDLPFAAFYVVWKLALWARPDPGRQVRWVRTARAREREP